ncbi:MAG: o-succinylbenzoate synthase [Candidatus Sedimenticola sp. 20ELBAFRAG]
MRIMDATLFPYRLKLKQPWVTARGSIDHREGWLVCVRGESGAAGWGDCAPLPDAGSENHDQCEQVLLDFVPRMRQHEATKLLEGVERLTPAARSGVETALLDLQAREQGISLADFISKQRRSTLRINAACGQLNDSSAACVTESVERGYDVVKLKVGLSSPEQEVQYLSRLVEQTVSGVRFRLDANGAWNMQQARDFIQAVKGLPVESLEEPLADPVSSRLETLQGLAPFPLALDESLGTDSSWLFMPSLPVKRVVLKPSVLGGPLLTMAWAEKAYAVGAEVVITSALESAVGVAMASQVAAALEHDAVHGLATGDWLESDVATVPRASAGTMAIVEGNGIGVNELV